MNVDLSSYNQPSSLSDQNILSEEQEIVNLLINEMKNENSYHYGGDIRNHDDLPNLSPSKCKWSFHSTFQTNFRICVWF